MSEPIELIGINPAPLLAEAVRHGSGGTALHLGAASGRNSLFLAANGYKVTAVDGSRSNLEVLAFAAHHAKLPVGVLLADTSDFKPAASYDLVLASAVLHFFDRESIVETIRMMQSITKPGGLNVLLISSENDGTGERPKLFETGMLPQYYADWQMLADEERVAKPEEYAGEWARFHRAGLVARRP